MTVSPFELDHFALNLERLSPFVLKSVPCNFGSKRSSQGKFTNLKATRSSKYLKIPRKKAGEKVKSTIKNVDYSYTVQDQKVNVKVATSKGQGQGCKVEVKLVR